MALYLSPDRTPELSLISLAFASSCVCERAQSADSHGLCAGRAAARVRSGRRSALAHRPRDGGGGKHLDGNSQRRSAECHRVGAVLRLGTGLHRQHQLLHPETTSQRLPRGLTGQYMQKRH